MPSVHSFAAMSYVGTGDWVRWECSQWVSDRVPREPPAPAVAPPSAVAEQGRQSTRQPPVLPFEALAVKPESPAHTTASQIRASGATEKACVPVSPKLGLAG